MYLFVTYSSSKTIIGVKESRPGRSGVIMLPRGDIDGPRGALAILQG